MTDVLDVPARPSGPVTLALIGAGSRGRAYAVIAAKRPDRSRLVAVAEPNPIRRVGFAQEYGLEPEGVFEDWQTLVAGPKIADVAVIALQDRDHHAAALAFIERGYHLLLEKPMGISLQECEDIVAAAEAKGTQVAVCHLLRYTPYTKALKAEVDAGAIGDIIGVEHLEPVGYYHYAHSFVRGNWRREDESTFILLAKTCHDIDWLGYIVGQEPVRTASFGGLHHFTRANQPEGAADRCLDCSVESTCPFSAVRIYRRGLREGGTERYFTEVITDEMTEEGVTRALEVGPYGRCVYACDNDVCDQQIVQLEYPNGVNASLTLSAFTPLENRHTKIFGSRGQLTGDGRFIEIYNFFSQERRVIDTALDGASAADGHAGGDEGLVTAFVDGLYEERPELITTGLRESLASHRAVFASERARREGRVVEI